MDERGDSLFEIRSGEVIEPLFSDSFASGGGEVHPMPDSRRIDDLS